MNRACALRLAGDDSESPRTSTVSWLRSPDSNSRTLRRSDVRSCDKPTVSRDIRIRVIMSHFRLLVANFAHTFRFYREVVGLPTTYPPDAAGPYAEFALGGDRYLGLFDRAQQLEALGQPTDSTRASDDHAVLCIAVEDVDDEVRRLRGLGIELVAPPLDHEPWGMRTAYVRDPEGNLVEFYGPLSGVAAPSE